MPLSNLTIDDRLSGLTEGQVACLRLVSEHYSSKEIARLLNISPHTVDQRLRGAIRTVGVQSRFEAARLYAELNKKEPSQSLIYQTPDVVNSVNPSNLGTATKRNGDFTGKQGFEDFDGNALVAKQTYAAHGLFPQSKKKSYLSSNLPFPRRVGDKNDMAIVERLGWIVAIAIASAVSFGGILAGLESLSRLSG